MENKKNNIKVRHTFKVLSKKEVERNRSSKYIYLKLDKQKIEKLKHF